MKAVVEPFVNSMPKEFLETMMKNVRKGATAMAKARGARRLSG